MTSKQSVCSFCHIAPTEKSKEVTWRIRDKTERLLFLVTGVISNLTKTGEAVRLLNDENAYYCSKHFFDASKTMQQVVDTKPDGSLNEVGIRIVEILASNVLLKEIKGGSMKKSIRIFIKNFKDREDRKYTKAKELVRYLYAPFKRGSEIVHQCVQCGEENIAENIQFLVRRHEKVAFGIFAGQCLSKIMNCEQAHAAALIPALPLCSVHLENQAWTLKSLEFKLHEEDMAKAFTEAAMTTFGKGWMDPLKDINCFINKYIPHQNNEPARCKFCKITNDSVVFDQLLNARAHWGCFKSRTQDILWDLREYYQDSNGDWQIRVPIPEGLECRENENLDKMLKAMKKYFGNEGLSKEQERVNVLVLFARYWMYDPKLTQKTIQENERLRSNPNNTTPGSSSLEHSFTPGTPIESERFRRPLTPYGGSEHFSGYDTSSGPKYSEK